MTYFDPPKPVEEVRLEVLKLAADHAPHDATPEQVVEAAATYEAYIVEGK
ncbi:hypothetical protein [Nonomuraea cavernae]